MKKAKGQVKLRTKPLKDGGRSLYLDIYRDGIRRSCTSTSCPSGVPATG